MEKYWIYIVVGLVCFLLGYITKDLITIEKKVEITIEKQKVKGKGNILDADLDIKVEEKKKDRWHLFKKKA